MVKKWGKKGKGKQREWRDWEGLSEGKQEKKWERRS